MIKALKIFEAPVENPGEEVSAAPPKKPRRGGNTKPELARLKDENIALRVERLEQRTGLKRVPVMADDETLPEGVPTEADAKEVVPVAKKDDKVEVAAPQPSAEIIAAPKTHAQVLQVIKQAAELKQQEQLLGRKASPEVTAKLDAAYKALSELELTGAKPEEARDVYKALMDMLQVDFQNPTRQTYLRKAIAEVWPYVPKNKAQLGKLLEELAAAKKAETDWMNGRNSGVNPEIEAQIKRVYFVLQQSSVECTPREARELQRQLDAIVELQPSGGVRGSAYQARQEARQKFSASLAAVSPQGGGSQSARLNNLLKWVRNPFSGRRAA